MQESPSPGQDGFFADGQTGVSRKLLETNYETLLTMEIPENPVMVSFQF